MTELLYDFLASKPSPDHIRVKMYGIVEGKGVEPQDFAYYTEFRIDPADTSLEPLMRMGRRQTVRTMRKVLKMPDLWRDDEQT